MRFCVRCGRELPPDQLIRGYCIECFKEYIGVFKQPPELSVVMCPKCLSWLFKGEWLAPADLKDVIKTISASELNKYIRDELALVDLEVISIREELGVLRASLNLYLKSDTATFTTTHEVPVSIKYRTCPRCISKTAGKYTHLIQVRFTRKNPPEYILKDVQSLLQKITPEASIVGIEYSEGGIDLELDDAAIAKRIVQAITREYAAKLTTTFKATRFDHRKGTWIGIVTYSLRIPVFERGDIVIYKNTIRVVEDVRKGRIVLSDPSTGTREEISLSLYWTGDLKYPSRIEIERYYVKSVEGDRIIAVNRDTGSEITIKRRRETPQLKVNDVIYLIKADNVETIVVGEISTQRWFIG